MKIKFLPHGLCLHHPLRNEPCEGAGVCLGCDNYITTPDFKEVHKNRLARVQEELASAQKDGPFEKKMRHIEQNLVEILRQLEGQSDGQ